MKPSGVINGSANRVNNNKLPRAKASVAAQAVALVLASAAVIWGLFAACGVAFPGHSGEWAVLFVYASYAVNVPLGLLSLAISLTVKQGSPRLRRVCLAVSIVALGLPVLASLISWSQRYG